MIVYHGSTMEVQKPNIKYAKENLDFGTGFYVTRIEKQAKKWAARKAMRYGGIPTVNIYEIMDMSKYRVREFRKADSEWLTYVVDCRNGRDSDKEYDVVMGKVANDDVFKCINMYMDGLWDEERTLREIRYYKNSDQIAFLTQGSIDDLVVFQGSYEVK